MSDDESPWAMVKRLESEGTPPREILVALKSRGLSDEDLVLLLRGQAAYDELLSVAVAAQAAAHGVRPPAPDIDVAGGIVAGEMFHVLGLAWVSGLVALVSALCFFYVPISIPLVAALAGSTTVCALSAFGYLRWKSRPEVLPDIAEGLPDLVLCEVGGVQFVAAVPTEGVAAGQNIAVRFRIQNCVNRLRSVVFRLSADGPKAGAGTAIPTTHAWSFPRDAGGHVGPGEIAELTVWVRAGPSAASQLTLWIEPEANGVVGRRVRYRDGTSYRRRIGADETVAGALFLGVVRFGGGYRVPIRLGDSTSAPATEEPLPAPEWKVVWTPTEAQLAKAEGR